MRGDVDQVSAFVAVPAILAALTAAHVRIEDPVTQFLILPPFAVVTYLVFRYPHGPAAKLRSILILPCIGAAIGELCFHFLGLSAAGVALDTVAVMLAQVLLRGYMPPALALSLLAMLLHADSPAYILGVVEASCVICVVFFAWRQFVRPLALESFLKKTHRAR